MGGGFEETFNKVIPGGAAIAGAKDLFGRKNKSPKVSTNADADILADQKKTTAQRSKLLKTAAGLEGEELMSGQTTRRDSVFGNA